MGKSLVPARAGGNNMKAFAAIVFSYLVFSSALSGSEVSDRARQLAKSGDSLGARAVLAEAVQRNPNDISALAEYAEFLDQYGDPAARTAYSKLLDAPGGSANPAVRATAVRRLITLDLLAGDNVAARKHFEAYQTAGGDGFKLPS